jgi:signal transduction histidine kinase
LSWLRNESVVPSETVQAFLEELVASASRRRAASSYREVRALETLLEETGIADHRAVASTLARFNFTSPEIVERFIDCLRLPMFLSLAESLAGIVEAATISEVSSQKIGEIVRALKYYAYSDNERTNQIQINESIQFALVLLRSHLKQVAEVKTDYDQDLPNIVCSSDIHQVWTNLLSNAIDATCQAGDGQRGQIHVTTRQAGAFVEVSISDNGTGIPPAIMSKIFDPFFTTKDVGKGTGLGLAVVAGIVKKHDGTIEVESRPGKTTITVRIPIVGVRAEAA